MDKSSCTVCSVPVSFSINDIVSCTTVVGSQILVVKEESISSKDDRVAAFITEKYEMVETIIIKESIKASFSFHYLYHRLSLHLYHILFTLITIVF